MVFRRQGTYGLVAVLLLAAVLSVLLASSVWAQDKSGDSKKDGQDSKQEKRVKNSETRTQQTKPPNKKNATQKQNRWRLGWLLKIPRYKSLWKWQPRPKHRR